VGVSCNAFVTQEQDVQDQVMKIPTEIISYTKRGPEPKELVRYFNEVQLFIPQLSNRIHISL
jgi:hypothetical protein